LSLSRALYLSRRAFKAPSFLKISSFCLKSKQTGSMLCMVMNEANGYAGMLHNADSKVNSSPYKISKFHLGNTAMWGRAPTRETSWQDAAHTGLGFQGPFIMSLADRRKALRNVPASGRAGLSGKDHEPTDGLVS